MECPNCQYRNGWDWIDDEHVETKGEHGEFYTLPIKLERTENMFDTETARVFGCPNCKHVMLTEY